MAYGVSKYGVNKYGEKGRPHDIDLKDCEIDLMQYLPWYEQDSQVFKEILGSAGEELCVLEYYIKDLEQQYFIDTATWGLAIYEKELGLNTNLNLSYEERREIINAKLLGSGTTTKQMIINTAQAFSGGEVDVLELTSEYKFIVQFIGVKGIPRNMQSFIEMLETIKPAHLTYEFKYTYTVWDMIDSTWDGLSNKTWDDLKVYEGE